MKTWNEATREDIVQDIAPGITATNADMINKLNWTSWLMNIGGLVEMDESNKFELTTREHFETIFLLDYDEQVRAMTGKYPEYGEVEKYMNHPETKKKIEYLTQVAAKLTQKDWPEFRDHICSEVGLDPNDFILDFETK